jgi:hypothetical protein
MRFPPNVARVRFGSSFSVRTWQTNLMYVTSLSLSWGISLLRMNLIVSVAFTRPLMPWANLPNSFAAEILQASLNFGCRDNWRYSRSWPVSGSRTGNAFSLWTHWQLLQRWWPRLGMCIGLPCFESGCNRILLCNVLGLPYDRRWHDNLLPWRRDNHPSGLQTLIPWLFKLHPWKSAL